MYEDLWHSEEVFMYTNLHTPQRGWVLINKGMNGKFLLLHYAVIPDNVVSEELL